MGWTELKQAMETSRSVKEVALRKEQTTHRVTVWWKLQAVLAIDVRNISGGSIVMVCNRKKHI